MKQITLTFLLYLCALTATAQREKTDSMSIQGVIDACIAMRDAAAIGDTAAIRQSALELNDAGVANFGTLRCKDDTIASLNGHLVFDKAFADSLAAGNTGVYDRADEMNSASFRRSQRTDGSYEMDGTSSHRGQRTNGSYFTKTCFVKAGKSTKYSFSSKGRQELAVVAEAGGLVTMKIHVTNSAGLDRRYDDTKAVKSGLPQRKTSFDLPADKRNTVELEIINCGKKDCSFVVISN